MLSILSSVGVSLRRCQQLSRDVHRSIRQSGPSAGIARIQLKNIRPPVFSSVESAEPAELVKKDWIYPAGQAWKCRQKVTSEAAPKLDAIRDEAIATGWSEARLYQNQGLPRTSDIEIISETAGRENRPRFFNPDV